MGRAGARHRHPRRLRMEPGAALRGSPGMHIAPTRRGIMLAATTSTLASAAGVPGYPPPSEIDLGGARNGQVAFPNWRGEAEAPPGPLANPAPPGERLGFAVIALGRIALEEVLPAFAECRHARPVALVSGSPDKARAVAAQYGIADVQSYDSFERLRDNPAVRAVYIALPNAMHREFTERAAAIGLHVLTEKPMATSAADCRAMIAACDAARVHLMVAYRCQYEPHNRAALALVRSRELGALRFIEAVNTQANGPGPQWRYNRALAGGGALPDIGLYCLNAARFYTGEEPASLTASTYSPPGDPRWAEVEESVTFTLRFPSGVIANCLSSYGAYNAKTLTLHFEGGTVEMPDAFSYRGQRLIVARRDGAVPTRNERTIRPRNQFALEIDHFAQCVAQDRRPLTPGEEGLADQLLMEAIYRAAADAPSGVPASDPRRGPAPD